MDYRQRDSSTEHRRVAAALRYDPNKDTAPKVSAVGRGEVAEKMLEVARRHGVPIYEDLDLAAALCKLDLDEAIPPELYRVVAEVLVFIYRMNRLASQQESKAQ